MIFIVQINYTIMKRSLRGSTKQIKPMSSAPSEDNVIQNNNIQKDIKTSKSKKSRTNSIDKKIPPPSKLEEVNSESSCNTALQSDRSNKVSKNSNKIDEIIFHINTSSMPESSKIIALR